MENAQNIIFRQKTLFGTQVDSRTTRNRLFQWEREISINYWNLIQALLKSSNIFHWLIPALPILITYAGFDKCWSIIEIFRCISGVANAWNLIKILFRRCQCRSRNVAPRGIDALDPSCIGQTVEIIIVIMIIIVIITVIILYWAAGGNNFFGYCDHPSSLSFITVITEIIIIIIMSLHSFGDFAKLNRHGKVKVLTFQVHLKWLLWHTHKHTHALTSLLFTMIIIIIIIITMIIEHYDHLSGG